MSLNFIPSVWAGRLLRHLETGLVYAQEGVANRDYEGEIRQYGDLVKIGSIGSVSVGDYTRDTDMEIQTLHDAEQMLAIDQQKYFNFMVDDVDKAQQNADTIDTAMQNASYELNKIADQRVAAHYIHAPADTGIGDDTTPIAGLAANAAYQLLVTLGQKLDERDVPVEGRFVVIPPFMHSALLMDDRFVASGGLVAEGTLLNGQISRAAGFNVLKSNNVPNTSGTKYKVIAGHPMAMSYAEQIVKVETYTTAKRFGTGVKGLHVYGMKLVRPQAWAVATVNNAASSSLLLE